MRAKLDVQKMDEKKRNATANNSSKSLPSAPVNTFQLKQASIPSGASNGVVQMVPVAPLFRTAVPSALKMLGKTAPSMIRPAAPAIKTAAKFVAGLGGLTTGLGMADAATQFGLGAVVDDKRMMAKGGIKGASMLAQKFLPKRAGLIGNFSDGAQEGAEQAFDEHGVKPVIDEDSHKPIPPEYMEILQTGSSHLQKIIPGFDLIDPTSAIDSGNNLAGRFFGLKEKGKEEEKKLAQQQLLGQLNFELYIQKMRDDYKKNYPEQAKL